MNAPVGSVAADVCCASCSAPLRCPGSRPLLRFRRCRGLAGCSSCHFRLARLRRERSQNRLVHCCRGSSHASAPVHPTMRVPAASRACGGSPPHERLRSRNSRHLQCCPFWCPRGMPAARHYPRGTGGGAGGGLRPIFWRIGVYFVGFHSSFGVGGERGPSQSSLVSRFSRSNRSNTLQRPASQLCSRGPSPSSAANLSNKEQGRHLLSRTTPNGHRGNFVFFINEICSLYLT
jgi:hypothetical protein